MRLLVRNAGLGFVGGLLIYGTGDVVGELTTYYKLRDLALEIAERNEELKAQIGYPYTPGPWYDAKIGFMGSSMAQCTFQLQGNKQVTDVTVRGLRAKGFQNRALYNLFGPGAWAVVDATAMFPDREGFVQPRSLLQSASWQGEGESGGAASDESSVKGRPHHHHHHHAVGKAPQEEKSAESAGQKKRGWKAWFSSWGGKGKDKGREEALPSSRDQQTQR